MRGSVLAPPKTMTEELFTLSVCAREGGGEGARERWGDSHEVPLIMVVGELGEEVARPDIINRSMIRAKKMAVLRCPHFTTRPLFTFHLFTARLCLAFFATQKL